MSEKFAVLEFWSRAVEAHPELANRKIPDAWSFGDTPEMADELALLVVQGKKTATSSRHSGYALENDLCLSLELSALLLTARMRPLLS